MKVKNIENEANLILQSENIQKNYLEELEKNPKYSLEVDPENKYKLSEEEKLFIKLYVDYKSISTAAELAGMDMDKAKKFYLSYASQTEIRRINLALYQRQFATRLLNLDELSGYLSSLLMDLNVPVADQLKTVEKLKVVQMLIDLYKLKKDSLEDPGKLMSKDLDTQIKELSITTIQKLLENSDDMKKKNNIIYEMQGTETLTPEESAYLSTLPTKDLLDLIDKTEGGKR